MPAISRQPRRKALCIGVEYIELSKSYPEWRLHGAHRDTEMFSELLQSVYGYQKEDIRILIDAKGDAKGSRTRPTRENIIAAMKDLVKDACAGDHLLFHYSGHGSQVPALFDTNEVDGFDEVIWPEDVKYFPPLSEDGNFSVEHFIIDDEVHKILVNKLPPGVHLAIVLDCCSSGTGADLPYSTGASPLTSPITGPINMFTRPRGKSVAAMPHYARGHMQKESASILPLPSRKWSDGDQLPHVTSWSACLDNQQTLENNLGGVFVTAFTEVLKEFPHPTHAQLLKGLTRWLANHVRGDVLQSSKPQLGSLRHIDAISNTQFEL